MNHRITDTLPKGEPDALLAAAKAQIRSGDPAWVATLLAAWHAAMLGDPQLETRAALFETLAEGRELQGRLAEAVECRLAAANARAAWARLQAIEEKLGLSGAPRKRNHETESNHRP